MTVMSYPWTYWILPGVVVWMWITGWRRDRRYRIRFALLTPVITFGGVVLSVVMTFNRSREVASSCVGADCHNVSGFTTGMDNPNGIEELIWAGSELAFFVAVPLTVVTLIVEGVLSVRRYHRRAADGRAATGR